MGLLRNSDESWVDLDNGGRGFDPSRKFRLNDPEAHIRRLTSFGAGMGIDLASTHPRFSNKQMIIGANGGYAGEPNARMSFDEHDEGLIHPVGLLGEAVGRINEQKKSGRVDPNDAVTAGLHLMGTRVPFQHETHIIPDLGERWSNEYQGRTTKLITPEPRDIPHPHSTTWDANADETGGNTFRTAMADFSHNIRKEIKSPGRHISDLINASLVDPVRSPSQRGTHPEHFSSQFVKILNKLPGHEPTGEDVIDLSTGTWAKIHPDEYFPH